MNENQITRVFCEVDDFVKILKMNLDSRLLGPGTRQRIRKTGLSDSEIMTLVILFHQSGYRTFKHFYCNLVRPRWRHLFPGMLSYTRFINLMPRVLLPLCAFLPQRFGRDTGIAFIDSTKLAVCNTKRIRSNRVFDGLAKIGKSSMGWFYAFKLHLVINDMG
jgi:hypothetical protein